MLVAPANGRGGDVALPPGVDLDDGAVPMPAAFTDVAVPVTLARHACSACSSSMASVVVRYRRADGAGAGPDALAAVVGRSSWRS